MSDAIGADDGAGEGGGGDAASVAGGMALSIGQRTILEREINRTYDTLNLFLAILRTRREVIDFGSLKALAEGLKQLAEDAQTDRAKSALLSDSDQKSVYAVQLAVLNVVLGSWPEVPETSAYKPIYDAAVRVLRTKWLEES